MIAKLLERRVVLSACACLVAGCVAVSATRDGLPVGLSLVLNEKSTSLAFGPSGKLSFEGGGEGVCCAFGGAVSFNLDDTARISIDRRSRSVNVVVGREESRIELPDGAGLSARLGGRVAVRGAGRSLLIRESIIMDDRLRFSVDKGGLGSITTESSLAGQLVVGAMKAAKQNEVAVLTGKWILLGKLGLPFLLHEGLPRISMGWRPDAGSYRAVSGMDESKQRIQRERK